MRRWIASLGCLALMGASPVARAAPDPAPVSAAAVAEDGVWDQRSPLALAPAPSPALDGAALAIRIFGRGDKSKPKAAPAPAQPAETQGLGAERARTLLRSIVLPGWGQAALGHRTSGAIFALAETGVWTSFAAFRIQEQMRRHTYERTAEIHAGIDLEGRSEEFRRLVGAYESNEDYNQLVVYRDAANLYYDDPVAYQAYIATHELKGADTWSWSSEDAIRDYRGQRKDAQRAALRANTALALAVINRLAATLHAARLKHPPNPDASSWKLEMGPAPGPDATAFRCALLRRF